MSVNNTYLNDNAHTPLNRFTVCMQYKQVCNKHGEKSNRWSLSLSVCSTSVDRPRCDNNNNNNNNNTTFV